MAPEALDGATCIAHEEEAIAMTAEAELVQWSKEKAKRLRAMTKEQRRKSMNEQRCLTRLFLERTIKTFKFLD
ncbi:hypothetical protein EON63_11390 [archaeon]|nr:MAG: hypothetical protein EON63_11390 [archaeon]